MADLENSSLARPISFSKSIYRSGRTRSLTEDFAAAQIDFSDINLESKPFAVGGAGQVYRGFFAGRIEIAAKATYESIIDHSNDELEQEVFRLKP
jgi:hypothetical protein